jgi:hypothetical protein
MASGDFWTSGEYKQKRYHRGGTTTTAASPAPTSTTLPPPPVVKPAEPYGKIVQTLLPYLSPEDSAALESFHGFAQDNRPVPEQVTGQLRNYYLGRERAQSAIGALQNMKAAGGGKDLGPGYTFLVNAVNLLGQYGGQGGEGMSRQAYSEFSTSLSNLLELAKGNQSLAPYANLVNLFASPTFSAGSLTGYGKNGPVASKKLYT